MKPKVNLATAKAKPRDVGRGMARIDREIMEKLGVLLRKENLQSEKPVVFQLW